MPIKELTVYRQHTSSSFSIYSCPVQMAPEHGAIQTRFSNQNTQQTQYTVHSSHLSLLPLMRSELSRYGAHEQNNGAFLTCWEQEEVNIEPEVH